MPNIKSAKKRVKVSEKKNLRNRMVKSGMRTAVKKFVVAVEADPKTANAQLTATTSAIDKAAAKGIIDKHVYAKGGINIDTIRRAKELGFGGVVVCHDLWSKFNIHSQLDFKELVGHFDRLRNVANA